MEKKKTATKVIVIDEEDYNFIKKIANEQDRNIKKTVKRILADLKNNDLSQEG